MMLYSVVEVYVEVLFDGEGYRFIRIDLLGIFYVKFLKNIIKGIRIEIKWE